MRRPKPLAPFLPDQALWLLPPLGLVLLICVCCFCLCLCCRGGSGGAGMYTGAAANALKIEVKGLRDDTADGQVRQTVAAGGRRCASTAATVAIARRAREHALTATQRKREPTCKRETA